MPCPLPNWGILLQPVGFLLFLVAGFAETNRNPFDLAEGENELVAGYHVEYSSVKFALFFMAEYANMAVVSFIPGHPVPGGVSGAFSRRLKPFSFTPGLALNSFMFPFVFVAGILFGSFVYLRADQQKSPLQGRENGWSPIFLAGLGFGAAILALAGLAYAVFRRSLRRLGAAAFNVSSPSKPACSRRFYSFCWLFVWVRWTLPRFRYDQLMKLGWRLMLPLALLNLLVTGVLILIQK